jgi:hypothetical protein
MTVKALRGLGHEVYPYAKYYQKNEWVEGREFGLDDHVFDLMLFMECNDGDPQYPELRLARARKTACWLFDTSYYADRCKRLVDYFGFDHLFLANPLTIQEYKVWGYNNVHYLPYACDSELHVRPLEYPKTRDVVLVGSIRDDRRALATELADRGINLELIGNVFREEYIDALASAKIVINQNPSEGRGLLNMRFFETSAAGSFIFTEDADIIVQPMGEYPGEMRMGYPYMNTETLAMDCLSLLDNPAVLQSHTKISQGRVLTYHTYHNRCEEILKTVFPNEGN